MISLILLLTGVAGSVLIIRTAARIEKEDNGN